MKKTPAFLQRQEKDEGGWISIADLMSGLVVIFLLIVVSYSFEVFEAKDKAINSINSLSEAKKQIKILQNRLSSSEEKRGKIRLAFEEQKKKTERETERADSLGLLLKKERERADIFRGEAKKQIKILHDELEEEQEKKRNLGLSWDEVRAIVEEWRNTEKEIYELLYEEFEEDLLRWGAEIEPETLVIRFRSPEVLFKNNEAELEDEFKVILDDFCPRYIALLKNNFSDENDVIDEVRIEGHTSSLWKKATKTEAYIGNMGLSQQRAKNVLDYCLRLQKIEDNYEDWVTGKVTAHGLSFSRLIYGDRDKENAKKSRRVEFTVKTDLRERIQKIQDILNRFHSSYEYGALP
ncbi:MAG: OmpA family protein [Alphaproteobacteria bacterium GM202ARS2]|nr:OmpA family protein [Alphaproteobacteria bacterium GM202ARS2]